MVVRIGTPSFLNEETEAYRGSFNRHVLSVARGPEHAQVNTPVEGQSLDWTQVGLSAVLFCVYTN